MPAIFLCDRSFRFYEQLPIFVKFCTSVRMDACGKTTVQLGLLGEQRALDHLLQQGLQLRARNWRYRHWELDLVMEGPDFLRIVEVRMRTLPSRQLPIETITKKKQAHLIRAASAYVRRFGIQKEVVFDVVSVLVNGEEFIIEYFPEAFYPLGRM